MKLNVTYPLKEVLACTSNASENLSDVVKAMKKAGNYNKDFTVFETVGMLSQSPYARVTLTRVNPEKNCWSGYMETSAYRDGPKVHVEVRKVEYVAIAVNGDYNQIKVVEA